MLGETLSSPTNIQKSSSQTEGVASGAGDDGIESIGLFDSHLGSGEANIICALGGDTL